MVPKNKGLGKGLGSLLGDMQGISGQPLVRDVSAEEAKTAQMIKLRDIEPNRHQPRKSFDEEELNELADSIRTYGIITPLILVKEKNHYMIIAGERRWRAAKLAGLKEVPAVIREYSEQQIAEIALVENIQRSDLNPIEEASAYEKLMNEYGMTQEELAERISKNRSTIANALRLLKLPEDVREMLINGTISAGHAKALLGLEEEAKMSEVAKVVTEKGWNVRDTEDFIRKEYGEKRRRKRRAPLGNQIEYDKTEADLSVLLKTKVHINRKQENAGKIEISYFTLEDLERILEHIK